MLITSFAACVSTSSVQLDNAWTQQIIDYKDNFDNTHPDSVESVLMLDAELKADIIDKFQTNTSSNLTAKKLAEWLISENGHGMIYDVNANLNPMEAFEQRRGNCLSFTLLFSALASELGIDIQFNIVDIPNIWGSDNDNFYILYRHINGILKTRNQSKVFDLAIELYDTRYPQKIVSREYAIAQLQSNKAIDKLNDGNFNEALHLIKFAISLSPENEDLWVNLGVILNHNNNYEQAEQSFLYAYSLNSKSQITASSLERFYSTHDQTEKIKKYRTAARKARESNPYYWYESAKRLYQESNYKEARSQIRKAIQLHEDDPSFYELTSLIAQQFQRYDLALKNVLIAYQLSHEVDEQKRYADKARLISKLTTKDEIRLQLEN